MIGYDVLAAKFDRVISEHRLVTVVSHVHPDADAIGTSLGVYGWLRERGHKVEVVNLDGDVPRYLDFLPHFTKLKSRIDFEDSLVIACDCGSVDRLGFEPAGRVVINIDHHPTNTHYGALNIVDPNEVASGKVAYELLSRLGAVSSDSAFGFYTAVVSDTRNFTTDNISSDVYAFANKMLALGVDAQKVNSNMNDRRSLASLRILGRAIKSLVLYHNGKVAVMILSREDIESSGAMESDIDGIVDYARSLVTVQLAVIVIERRYNIKVSMRSKGVNVASIAQSFGGGGHKLAAGFEVPSNDVSDCVEKILETIESEEVLA